jgi:hypothetical protein
MQETRKFQSICRVGTAHHFFKSGSCFWTARKDVPLETVAQTPHPYPESFATVRSICLAFILMACQVCIFMYIKPELCQPGKKGDMIS